MPITPEQREYLDKKLGTVGLWEDMGKTAIGSTIPRGAAGAAMWLGDLANLGFQGAVQGGAAIYDKVADEPLTPEQRRRLDAAKPFFSSTDAVEAAEDATGVELYDPVTPAAKLLDTAGQFAIGSKAGGGRLLTGAGAGAASELAGMATEGTDYEVAARVLGAVAGGMATSSASKNAARLSAKGAKEFSDARAKSIIGKQLAEDGVTKPRLDAAIRKGELDLDLAEATGSRGLQRVRKSVAQSPTKGGRDISRFVESRNNAGVRSAVERVVKPLKDRGRQGYTLRDEVISRNAGKSIDIEDIVDDVLKEAVDVRPDSLKGRVLNETIKELAFAQERGGTFDALHRARQQIDNLFIEGADTAVKRQASAATSSVRKALNQKLAQIDPDYAKANRDIQADIAAEKILETLKGTNEGSVGTLYNKLSKAEFEEELKRMLDPSEFMKIKKTLSQLRKIKKGGMGGSDTAGNQAAMGELQGKTGLAGIESATDLAKGAGIGAKIRDVSARFRERDYESIAQQLRNPDVDGIKAAIDRANVPLATKARQAITPTPQGVMRSTVGITQPSDRERSEPVAITPEQRQYLDRIMGGSQPVNLTRDSQPSTFDDAFNHVLEVEGGYVPDDAGAGPTNMGINKRANPDLDIEGMTQGKARDVYKKRYWDAIGADKLPPKLAMVAFDAAVNQGPSKAKQFLKESGGDPMKYLLLREKHYANLVKMNPRKYAKYGEGWLDRLNKLKQKIMEA